MAEISVMLVAIDHALARPRGPRGTVLEVRQPDVLGQRARYLRDDQPEYSDDGVLIYPGGPVYGLTKRQCRRIRDTIYAAARADLGGAG
jgi:hypothetical protein